MKSSAGSMRRSSGPGATSPQLAGVIWWEWNAGEGGPNDYGYTPKGKPAEQLLRKWFSAGKAANGAEAANSTSDGPRGVAASQPAANGS